MATFTCVWCGAPVNRRCGTLTADKDGWQCGDVEDCLKRQAEKELPTAENAEVG